MEKKSGIFTETFNKVLKPTFEQKKSKTKFFFCQFFIDLRNKKKHLVKKSPKIKSDVDGFLTFEDLIETENEWWGDLCLELRFVGN